MITFEKIERKTEGDFWLDVKADEVCMLIAGDDNYPHWMVSLKSGDVIERFASATSKDLKDYRPIRDIKIGYTL